MRDPIVTRHCIVTLYCTLGLNKRPEWRRKKLLLTILLVATNKITIFISEIDYLGSFLNLCKDLKIKKISNDQELIQSDPINCIIFFKCNTIIFIVQTGHDVILS